MASHKFIDFSKAPLGVREKYGTTRGVEKSGVKNIFATLANVREPIAANIYDSVYRHKTDSIFIKSALKEHGRDQAIEFQWEGTMYRAIIGSSGQPSQGPLNGWGQRIVSVERM